VLLEIDADAAEEHLLLPADVLFVGERRRVEGQQRDVVALPISSAASALSRRQLPQYIDAAPQ
jgi:hypothetical protein